MSILYKLGVVGLSVVCASVAPQATANDEPVAVAQADFKFVFVKQYQVEGNSLLPVELVDAIFNRYTGSVSFDAIQEAARLLQMQYRARGFGTVVVTVPPQNVTNQTVLIRVVEGKLATVQTAGLTELSINNVERGLPALETGQTVNFQDLDSQLLMVNESPVKNARVVFQPGVKPEQVDALVIVQEKPVHKFGASVDNTGTRSTGRGRLNLSYQHGNLFDRDVVTNLRYTTSLSKPSQVSLFSGSVRVPFYGPQLFVETFARYSNTENTPNQTPAGELSFAGQGQSIGFRVLRTLNSASEIKQQVYVGIEARRFDNTCNLGNFGAAGCGSLGLDLNVQPFSMGYIAQKQGSFIASAQLIRNIPGGKNGDQAQFDAIRPGAKAEYTKAQLNGYGVLSLPLGLNFQWRFDSQASGDSLVASEQFGLGGAYGVRGYEERELAGDSGGSFAAEVGYALGQSFDLPDWLRSAEVYGFLDGGGVINNNEITCDPVSDICGIWSYGAGFRVSPVRSLSAQASFGVAGRDAAETQQGDSRAHVNISYEF